MVFGFMINYFEIVMGGSYENKFILYLFVYMWLLVVEMYFYILWGLIVWLVVKISWWLVSGWCVLICFCWGLGLLIIVFVIESFVMMYFGVVGLKDFLLVYFLSLIYCFLFFVGGFIGVLSGIKV